MVQVAKVLVPWQAALLAQGRQANGVKVEEVVFDPAKNGRRALTLHTLLRDHRLAIYQDENLIDELMNVQLQKQARASTGSTTSPADTTTESYHWRYAPNGSSPGHRRNDTTLPNSAKPSEEATVISGDPPPASPAEPVTR